MVKLIRLAFPRVLPGMLAGVLALTAPMAVAAPGNGLIHQYTLRFADDLRSVAVRAELAMPPAQQVSKTPLQLTARHGRRSDLSDLQDCGGQPLRRAKTLRLPAGVYCITYTARLREEERYGRAGSAIQTSPSTWLWIPELDERDKVRVDVLGSFAAPPRARDMASQVTRERVSISVPWRALGPRHVSPNTSSNSKSETQTFAVHRYEFGASPESSRGLVVLGGFSSISLAEVGLRKPIAYVGPADEAHKMASWLSAVLHHVTQVGGELPNPDMQVILWSSGVRTSASRSPVPFGHVIRDQGETVRFFVDARRSLSDLRRDWTAAHEFAHLFLPYVQGRQKWISEGFASYYQNVLQARAGEYDEPEVWQRLTRSFKRAAEDGVYGSPNQTANENFGRVRMMIYWSGAAIALLGDAQLRALTDNEVTLDSALAELAKCCLPSQEIWQGRRLFAKLDELTGHDVFVPLYDRFANSPGMPDTRELFARLGVRGTAENARLVEDAEWVDVRRAIMGARR